MTGERARKVGVKDDRYIAARQILSVQPLQDGFHVLTFVVEDLDERFARVNRDHVTFLQPHVVPGEFEWLESQCICVGPRSRGEEVVPE